VNNSHHQPDSNEQKVIFDVLSAFKTACWSRFARRADLEWKFSFGIWTATATLTGILLTDKISVAGRPIFIWMVIYAVVLSALHVFWQVNLIARNNGDRDEEDYYEQMIGERFKITLFPGRHKRNRGIKHYSPVCQLSITILLNSFLLLVVWARTK